MNWLLIKSRRGTSMGLIPKGFIRIGSCPEFSSKLARMILTSFLLPYMSPTLGPNFFFFNYHLAFYFSLIPFRPHVGFDHIKFYHLQALKFLNFTLTMVSTFPFPYFSAWPLVSLNLLPVPWPYLSPSLSIPSRHLSLLTLKENSYTCMSTSSSLLRIFNSCAKSKPPFHFVCKGT